MRSHPSAYSGSDRRRFDILNPVQFTAHDMDLKRLKADFGKDLVFWGSGGIDTQSTLCQGTPDEVRDQVKRILDIMAPGGGYVFAPSTTFRTMSARQTSGQCGIH